MLNICVAFFGSGTGEGGGNGGVSNYDANLIVGSLSNGSAGSLSNLGSSVGSGGGNGSASSHSSNSSVCSGTTNHGSGDTANDFGMHYSCIVYVVMK